MSWPYVEPNRRFIPGWHIDAMCDHLEAVARGQIKELIINIPPGCSKSTLVSVMYPVWRWTNQPHLRFITATFAGKLVTDHCMKSRMLIASEWFSQRWGEQYNEWCAKGDDDLRDAVLISPLKDTQTEYRTTQKGMRFGTSVAPHRRSAITRTNSSSTIPRTRSALILKFQSKALSTGSTASCPCAGSTRTIAVASSSCNV